ncbi:SWIM zinc finger family protein [Myroides fluvii]|uniref:SWIM zinc finger family protein n=1 Tax=Myroides fluvii TaxID=2572594 RepID=UPI00131DA068|nr:SWIM zinc finger family protein [Myroides fluvii]
MNIQERLKQLTAKEKAQIKAVEVRELDEEDAGHFVAFVDEGEETYDVQIHLDDQQIKQLTCDCGTTSGLCIHQGAVLLQITQKGLKVAPTQLVKKSRAKAKQTVSTVLVQEQSKEVLAQWLVEVFKKNKTLEQQFIVTFSQEKVDYTVEYVEEIMQQTFKAVAGRRKTLEGVKIKKILDTLAIAFEPVNDFITVNIDKPIAYELFSKIMLDIQAFDRRISHHSKKFTDFYQSYSTWFALTLNNTQNQSVWQEQVKQLMHRVFIENSNTRTVDTVLLKHIYDHVNLEQQKDFAFALQPSVLQTTHTRYDFKMDFVSFIRDVALTHDFYEEVYPFFAIKD